MWLSAPSGAGKSRLAREYARRHDDAIYIDFGRQPAPNLADSLADSPTNEPDQQIATMSSALDIQATDADALREALSQTRMAFFEGDFGAVASLFPADASLCRVDGPVADGEPFEVGPLDRDSALELLVDRVRRGDPEFAPGPHNREALDELIVLSSGWPLVLEQLGRRLILFTPGELLEQAGEASFAWKGAPDADAWESELQRLDPIERDVLGAALALPDGFDAATIEAVTGHTIYDVASAVETLCDALIVRRIDPRSSERARFRVETTAHAVAVRHQELARRGASAVFDHWVRAAREFWGAKARDGGMDASRAVRKEQHNMIHASEQLGRASADGAALIASAVFESCRTGWLTERETRWEERVRELGRQAESAEAATAATLAYAKSRRSGRHFDEVVEILIGLDAIEGNDDLRDAPLGLLVKLELARCYHLTDRFEEELELFEAVRDAAPRQMRACRAEAHIGIALHDSTLLRFASARDELAHAMVLAKELASGEIEVRVRQAQISVTMSTGDYAASLVHAEAIVDELPDDVDERRLAGAHLQIADIQVELGQIDDVLNRVDLAEELLRDESFARIAGYCDYVRAKVSLLRGEPADALRSLTLAAEKFGSDQGSFLLSVVEELARVMDDPKAIRLDMHDDLVERSAQHWAPLGVAIELLLIACRRYAERERPGDTQRLAELRDEADEAGMTARRTTAQQLLGAAVEPNGFDGHIVAALFPATRGDRHLTIGPRGRWFRVGGAEATDIAGRKALPELLVAIAGARGEALDPYELAEAGWPDEKLHPETAKNRVYVAVHALRKMGLAELLRTEGGGYSLADGVTVEMEKG